MMQKNRSLFVGIFIVLSTLFSGLGYFAWTIMPYFQGKEYLAKAKIAVTPNVIIDDAFIFNPMSNAQGLIRVLLVSALIEKYNEGLMTTPSPLFDFAIGKLEEYNARYPYYFDYNVLLAKAYNTQAELKQDPALLKKAETYYQRSLSLAPGRQDVLFSYALNLLNQNRTQESIAMLRAVVAQNPELPDAHYQLGQALAVTGKANYDEVLKELEFSLDRNHNFNPALTLQLYQKLFYYYYHKGDMTHLDVTIQRLAKLDLSQQEAFLKLSEYIHTYKKIPLIDINEG